MKHIIQFAALALLAGCAAVPRDAGFAEVQAALAQRVEQSVMWWRDTAEDAEAEARIRGLLAQPLTADAAVQVALLNNRGLQAEYEELGVAQADVVQAGLFRNPVLGWMRQEGGDLTRTTWGFELDFLGLLLVRPRQRIEDIRFAHVKLRVTQAVLRHAAETRKAWYEVMAAEQSARFLQQAGELADAEAMLGERQRTAGTLALRDALRQQVFAAEVEVDLAHARQTAFAARERLNRLMGTGDEQVAWQLPSRLPLPPAEIPPYASLEADGVARRLDVQLAQKEAEAFASALGLTRNMRFINVFDLGVETEHGSGERRITGPVLRIELPVFDQGQARLSRQESLYRQSEMRLYQSAVNARSEIREAWQRLQAAHAAVRHARETLVPLRRRIVEQSALHYNGMLIGVYELLADARAQMAAVQQGIFATREYWTALADLQMAVGGRLPQPSTAGGEPAGGGERMREQRSAQHEEHAK